MCENGDTVVATWMWSGGLEVATREQESFSEFLLRAIQLHIEYVKRRGG